VLGRALRPLAEDAGHEVAMPGHDELDLFDPAAVAGAVHDVDGVLHLATRIRSLEEISDPDAWHENDRLRADASRVLVDAAIAAGVEVYEYQGRMAHEKVAVIDGTWATAGSSNLDDRSLEFNDELNYVIVDKGFARKISTDLFDKDLAKRSVETFRAKPLSTIT